VANGLTLQQQRFVSAMVGDAHANASEACRLAGYKGNANTLGVVGFQNLRKPNIALAIKEAEAKIERRGIAIKQTRIDAKVHRWFILEAVRRARIEAFATQVEEDAVSPPHRRRAIPPGWESGLHVRQVKALPNGRGGSEIVEEFALDTAMMREFDILEKDIAHELGELVDKKEIRHDVAIRQLAEQVAIESGLDARLVVAEAERILSGLDGS